MRQDRSESNSKVNTVGQHGEKKPPLTTARTCPPERGTGERREERRLHAISVAYNESRP